MKKHPALEQLALLAGGDLALPRRVLLRMHLKQCAECRIELAHLEHCRSQVKQDSLAMPEGLDWENLALEMRANIRLGLAAGAVVQEDRVRSQPAGSGWRLAVVLGSMAFVAVTGWMLRPQQAGLPGFHAPTAVETQVVLDVRPDELAVRERGSALTLMGPTQQPLVTAVSWDGTAQARFQDAQTGQVTLYDVSAQ
jgi:hypothetical protein